MTCLRGGLHKPGHGPPGLSNVADRYVPCLELGDQGHGHAYEGAKGTFLDNGPPLQIVGVFSETHRELKDRAPLYGNLSENVLNGTPESQNTEKRGPVEHAFKKDAPDPALDPLDGVLVQDTDEDAVSGHATSLFKGFSCVVHEFEARNHGGHVKAGETIEQAAVRETKEETGLDTEVIRIVGFNQWIDADFVPKKPSHYIQFTVLLGLKDESQQVKLNDEATEYVWATPEEILESNEYSRYAKELVNKIAL